MSENVLIDYSGEQQIPCRFTGSEKKISILVDGIVYMLKFPDPIRSKANEMSYMNNVFSEYISCHIFESCGIPAQHTSIGVYTSADGITRPVVACRDLTADGRGLQEFARLPQEQFDSGPSPRRGNSIDLEYVYDLIRSSKFVSDPEKVIQDFWDIFILDALTMNPDRHLENLALTFEEGSPTAGARMSPVYDCGSSLFALATPEEQSLALNDKNYMKQLVVGYHSCYAFNGARIQYLPFFKSSTHPDFLAAVRRIAPRIDFEAIDSIVADTPLLEPEVKNFYKAALRCTFENIIEPGLRRARRIDTPEMRLREDPPSFSALSAPKEDGSKPKNRLYPARTRDGYVDLKGSSEVLRKGYSGPITDDCRFGTRPRISRDLDNLGR